MAGDPVAVLPGMWDDAAGLTPPQKLTMQHSHALSRTDRNVTGCFKMKRTPDTDFSDISYSQETRDKGFPL